MLSTDRTLELKEAVNAAQLSSSFPPKRPRLAPTPTASSDDNWTRQAEQVATNLRSFSTFLASVRRAYLDLSSSSAAASHLRTTSSTTLDPSKGLKAWEGVRFLSERDRDEIDFGVKVALRGSVDRVRELEGLEKARLSLEAKRNPNHSLTRLLGLPLPPSSHSGPSQILASHRACITHYLNTLLARVSHQQREQQETRVQRSLDRSANLSGGLGGMESAGKKLAEKSLLEYSLTGGSKGRKQTPSTIGFVPSIYKPSPLSDPLMSEPDPDDIMLSAALSNELSSAQIQQFEAEESALLQSTQTDLASLKAAESSLLEISALQSQLAIHLSQQSEMTDQLWEEAVGVTGQVEGGNVQLRQARERNREGRVWLLVLLMMASGTLVFLDYYS